MPLLHNHGGLSLRYPGAEAALKLRRPQQPSGTTTPTKQINQHRLDKPIIQQPPLTEGDGSGRMRAR